MVDWSGFNVDQLAKSLERYPYTLGTGTKYGVQIWPDGKPMTPEEQRTETQRLLDFMMFHTGGTPTGPVPGQPTGGAAVPGATPSGGSPEYQAVLDEIAGLPKHGEAAENSRDYLAQLQEKAAKLAPPPPVMPTGSSQGDIDKAVQAAIDGLKAKGLLNNPDWDEQLRTSKERARLDVASEAKRRGLDYTPMHDDVMTQLDRIALGIPKDAKDFNQFYGPGIGAKLLDDEQSFRRNQALGQLNNQFRAGFENEAIGNEFDDPFIDQIYNEQLSQARTLLDNSLKRGNLNDQGYNSALTGLERQGTAARSKLGALGQSLLGKYRTSLGQIGSEARTAASNLTLGNSFSLDPYKERIDTTINDIRGNIGGELRSAAGENLFDIGTLLGQAGGQQGAVSGSMGGSPLYGALNNRNRKFNQSRGVGSEGAF